MILISNCIYKIENCLNGHIYIGMTNDFERRMTEHINTSFNEFSASEECYVGYGTLWKMVNTPEFYDK